MRGLPAQKVRAAGSRWIVTMLWGFVERQRRHELGGQTMRAGLIGERIGESVTGLIFWSGVLFFGTGGRLWKKYFQRQGEPWRALVLPPPEQPEHGNQEKMGGLQAARGEGASAEGWASTGRTGPVG